MISSNEMVKVTVTKKVFTVQFTEEEAKWVRTIIGAPIANASHQDRELQEKLLEALKDTRTR